MADFNTPIKAEQGSAVTPQQGGGFDTGPAINSLADAIGRLGPIIRAGRADRAEAAGNQTLSRFRIDLERTDAAVEQGVLSVDAAQTRQRSLLAQGIAGNPGLQGEFQDTYSQFSRTSPSAGLPSAIERETTAQQKAIDGAIGAGLLNRGDEDNPELVAEAIRAHQTFLASETELKALQTNHSLAAGVREERARVAISGLAKTGQTQVQAAIRRADVFFNNNQPDQAVAIMNQLEVDFNFMAQNTAFEYKDLISAYTGPLFAAIKNARNKYNGTTRRETAENNNAANIAAQNTISLANPDTLQVVAALELLGPAVSQIDSTILRGVVNDVLSASTQPQGTRQTVNFLGGDEHQQRVIGTALDLTTTNIKELNAGRVDDPEQEVRAREQTSNTVRSVLRSLHANRESIQNPKEYKRVLEFLASPDTGRFIKEDPNMTAEEKNNALAVIRNQMIDSLIPTVRDNMSIPAGVGFSAEGLSPGVSVNFSSTPLNELVTPMFKNGGVFFEIAEGVPRSNQLTSAVDKLNSKAAPPINLFVRSTTNLLGRHGDEKAVYEENVAPRLFPEAVEEDGTDTSADATSPVNRDVETFRELDDINSAREQMGLPALIEDPQQRQAIEVQTAPPEQATRTLEDVTNNPTPVKSVTIGGPVSAPEVDGTPANIPTNTTSAVDIHATPPAQQVAQEVAASIEENPPTTQEPVEGSANATGGTGPMDLSSVPEGTSVPLVEGGNNILSSEKPANQLTNAEYNGLFIDDPAAWITPGGDGRGLTATRMTQAQVNALDSANDNGTQYLEGGADTSEDTGVGYTPDAVQLNEGGLSEGGVLPEGDEAVAGEPIILGTTSEGRAIVANSDGSVSTERSVTVQDDRLNEGRPTNIPTMYGGKQVTQEEAIELVVANGGVDPDTDQVLPGFDTMDEAVAAAEARSEALSRDPNIARALDVRRKEAEKAAAKAAKAAKDLGGVRRGTASNVPHAPLFDVISMFESPRMGYNSSVVPSLATDYSNMTVAEVWDYQGRILAASGRLNSTAVGRYQFTKSTMKPKEGPDLITQMGLDPNTQLFTNEFQDQLALFRMQKTRGWNDWVNGIIDDNQMINNLAQEWAGMPTSKGLAYYPGPNNWSRTAEGKRMGQRRLRQVRAALNATRINQTKFNQQ